MNRYAQDYQFSILFYDSAPRLRTYLAVLHLAAQVSNLITIKKAVRFIMHNFSKH